MRRSKASFHPCSSTWRQAGSSYRTYTRIGLQNKNRRLQPIRRNQTVTIDKCNELSSGSLQSRISDRADSSALQLQHGGASAICENLGRIRRGVVDDQDFETTARMPAIEDRCDAARDEFFFIMRRYDGRHEMSGRIL